MSNRVKRPGYEHDFESREEIEDLDVRERMETRAKNAPPKLGRNSTEAVGKVVAFVKVINDLPDWQAVEFRFTVGMLLHFEFTTTRNEIKPKYREVRRGDIDLIRIYGMIPIDDETEDD